MKACKNLILYIVSFGNSGWICINYCLCT